MKKWIIFRFFSFCDFGGTKTAAVAAAAAAAAAQEAEVAWRDVKVYVAAAAAAAIVAVAATATDGFEKNVGDKGDVGPDAKAVRQAQAMAKLDKVSANEMSKMLVEDVPASLDVQLNVVEVRKDGQVGCHLLLVDVLLKSLTVKSRCHREISCGS